MTDQPTFTDHFTCHQSVLHLYKKHLKAAGIKILGCVKVPNPNNDAHLADTYLVRIKGNRPCVLLQIGYDIGAASTSNITSLITPFVQK